MRCVRPMKVLVYPNMTRVQSLLTYESEHGQTDVFCDPATGETCRAYTVGCGSCPACRAEYARQWSIRNVCESLSHSYSYFLTLTYDDEHIPLTDDGIPTLRFDDVSSFIKRLRNYGTCRFFACSEYGGHTLRPHYHVLLYGFELTDLKKFSKSGDNMTFYSPFLNELWGHGFVNVADFSAESAAYVSGYAAKKLYSDSSVFDQRGMEIPALRMSRRPGIGGDFYEKNYQKFFENGSVYVLGGSKASAHGFYRQKMKADERVEDRFQRLADMETSSEKLAALSRQYSDSVSGVDKFQRFADLAEVFKKRITRRS